MDETEDREQEGKKGSSGKGSGGSGGVRPLSINQHKDVVVAREQLTGNQLVARLAEFFSELPARASAHVEVSWANLKNKGFAIVTQFLQWGQGATQLLHNLTRENIERLRNEYGIMIPGPSG